MNSRRFPGKTLLRGLSAMLALLPAAVLAGDLIMLIPGRTIELDVASGLSEQGQERAEALAELLSGQDVDELFVTPFRSCRETAAPIAAALELQPKEILRAQLGDLAGKLVKSDQTVVLVAWEADVRVLWRQLDQNATLTTPLGDRVLLLRPDVPGLPALTLKIP